MKFLFLVFLFVGAAVALTDHQKEKLRRHNEQCLEESGVNPAKVKKFREGDWSDSGKDSAHYWFCMMRKSDVITEEGVFKLEEGRGTVDPEDPQREAILRAMDVCKGEDGEDAHYRAINTMKCYHRENPGHNMF